MSHSSTTDYPYSLNFLSENLWTASDVGGAECNTTLPIYQTSRPFELTYRFLRSFEDVPYPGLKCNEQFGPQLQAIQSNVFSQLSAILPHISFREVEDTTEACLNFVLCDNLQDVTKAAGMAYLPPEYNTTTNRYSTIFIHNGYLPDYLPRLSLETSTTIVNNLGIDFLKGFTEAVFAHETGHAMGLLHTHEDPKYANDLRYTQCSSIMSYAGGRYSDVHTSLAYIKDLMTGSPITPMRTTYGPLDIENLKFAYGIGPSIETWQTEDTFICPKKESPSILPVGTALLSFPAQIALGITVAAINLSAPIVADKAEKAGYTGTAKVARAISRLTPPEPSPTASWEKATTNAAHGLVGTTARVMLPLAALAHDITHDVGSTIQHQGLGWGTVKLATSAVKRGAQCVASGAIGILPFYSIYALSKTAEDSPGLLETIKSAYNKPRKTGAKICASIQESAEHPLEAARNLAIGTVKFLGKIATNIVTTPCALVVNTPVISHLSAGSRFYNWVNRKKVPATSTTAAVQGVASAEEVKIDIEDAAGAGTSTSTSKFDGDSSRPYPRTFADMVSQQHGFISRV